METMWRVDWRFYGEISLEIVLGLLGDFISMKVSFSILFPYYLQTARFYGNKNFLHCNFIKRRTF